jgi:murein DD-endopeptidase MepM/ murein hydrolase activator NlpD
VKTFKKARNYSVIIVSDATSTNKEFTVSSKLVKNAVLGFSFLVLFFGFILFHYLTMTLDKQKMERLELDAKQGRQKISEMSSTIKVLNDRLQTMEIYKERIMVATGLTSPLALREVGSGGPDASLPGGDLAGAPAILPGTPLRQDTLPQTATIRDKAQKIEDSLKTVEKYVSQQKLQLAATPAIMPTRGILTGFFGNRLHPFTGRYEFHSAVDIATQLGNKIIAPADGIVLVAETRDYYGKMIIIDHGFGYVTRYGHLSGYNVREGQRIKRYDVIGYIGTTGRSNGPHLHYEVRYYEKPMNPLDFILDN